jgi:ectoine hydroxylase-related dioxygenase (phytanoyl-CoA dioxygenase family)
LASSTLGGRSDTAFVDLQSLDYKRILDRRGDLRLSFPELRPIVAKTAAIAQRLLDEEVRVIYDLCFMKPSAENHSKATGWHQDLPYVPIDRRGLLTIWIALIDVLPESGALQFLPGSHRLGPLGRLDLREDIRLTDLLRADDYAFVSNPVTVSLRAGEATVHDGLTLHGSHPNATSVQRLSWALRFIPANTRWLGGPLAIDGLEETGMRPFDTFDDSRFLVPA